MTCVLLGQFMKYWYVHETWDTLNNELDTSNRIV